MENELFKLNEFVISFLFSKIAFVRYESREKSEGFRLSSTNGFVYEFYINKIFTSSTQFRECAKAIPSSPLRPPLHINGSTVHIPLPISNQYTFTLLYLMFLNGLYVVEGDEKRKNGYKPLLYYILPPSIQRRTTKIQDVRRNNQDEVRGEEGKAKKLGKIFII